MIKAIARGTYTVNEGIRQDVVVGGKLREGQRLLLGAPRRHCAIPRVPRSRTEIFWNTRGRSRCERDRNSRLFESNNGQRELKRRSTKEWTKGWYSSAPLQLRQRSKHSLREAHQSEPARPTWSRDARALRRDVMERGLRRDKTSSTTAGNQWGGPTTRVSMCCAPTSEEPRDVMEGGEKSAAAIASVTRDPRKRRPARRAGKTREKEPPARHRSSLKNGVAGGRCVAPVPAYLGLARK